MTQTIPPSRDDTTGDVPEQVQVRKAKRERLFRDGVDPYPATVARTHSLAQVRDKYASLPAGESSGDTVTVAGRILFLRDAGKMIFAVLQEGDGTRLQAMLSQKSLGSEAFEAWQTAVDIGDVVAVTGEVATSKRGELSVLTSEWSMCAKAIHPLPVLHKDLSEENRVRQRYLDLIVRPASRHTARLRPQVVRAIRDLLHSRGYVEVETPMLQTQPGGAAARPFVTRSNALDLDLYLRIAPELFLKRCLVGGLERVFEINRNFRNEGIDSTHSPEFSMLEAYEAYVDYDAMAELTQTIIQSAADSAFGSHIVALADGSEYDVGGTWRHTTLFTALSEALGEDVGPDTDREHLARIAERHGLEAAPHHGTGKLAEELFEHLVAPTLHAPTFVRDFPEETSPLTRTHRTSPGLTEKWDLYVRGFELATGYSELVDPVIQRERFLSQARLRVAGDDEAMRIDEDFLRAMEYGMPPAGGMGMGMDRLLMALTGLGVRETILFPLVKPL